MSSRHGWSVPMILHRPSRARRLVADRVRRDSTRVTCVGAYGAEHYTWRSSCSLIRRTARANGRRKSRVARSVASSLVHACNGLCDVPAPQAPGVRSLRDSPSQHRTHISRLRAGAAGAGQEHNHRTRAQLAQLLLATQSIARAGAEGAGQACDDIGRWADVSCPRATEQTKHPADNFPSCAGAEGAGRGKHSHFRTAGNAKRNLGRAGAVGAGRIPNAVNTRRHARRAGGD